MGVVERPPIATFKRNMTVLINLIRLLFNLVFLN